MSDMKSSCCGAEIKDRFGLLPGNYCSFCGKVCDPQPKEKSCVKCKGIGKYFLIVERGGLLTHNAMDCLDCKPQEKQECDHGRYIDKEGKDMYFCEKCLPKEKQVCKCKDEELDRDAHCIFCGLPNEKYHSVPCVVCDLSGKEKQGEKPKRTIQQNIALIEKSANEWSCGYNDSACTYIFRKGDRGAGAMIHECCHAESYYETESGFEEAVNEWVEYLIKQGLIHESR